MNQGSKPPPMRLALWMVAILLSLVVAPVYGAPANAPTPGATDGGQSYFVTWFGTGKGSNTREIIQSGEHIATQVWTTTLLRQGSALVKFDRNGLHRSLQIISNAESYQSDYSIKSFCNPGPHNPGGGNEHWHSSLIAPNSPATSDPYLSRDFIFVPSPPYRLDDGSWEVPARPPSPAGTFLESDTFQDICGPANGIKRGLSPSTIRVRGYYPGSHGGVYPSKAPDWLLKSKTPDSFSGHFNWVEQQERGPPAEMEMDWTVTVRRIGKCRIIGEIPLNDNPINPDINDEDIEMGVEYGKSSIDPDTGIAPLNIRVTCDQVPIKNARVQVKVEVQKSTGGHLHDAAGRPRGSLKWNGVDKTLTDQKPSIEVKTDDDGRAQLTFKPGKAQCCLWKKQECAKKDCPKIGIAGIYKITATSARFPNRKAEVAVEAKVDGLSPLDADPNYVDNVGAGNHCSGDNATAATKKGLHPFAEAFYKAQLLHNDQLTACGQHEWPIYPLWVIDVSLPFGGLYDLGPGSKFWSTPHQTHGRGDGVDFSVHRRANSKNAWPADKSQMPICDGYTISPQGWLMMKMWELGSKYGSWDNTDFNAPSQPWHLHVSQ